MAQPGSETAYTYSVSLRIWHPRLSADEISSALSLSARPARATPSAQSSSTENVTFWSAVLEHDPSDDLAPFLNTVTSRLHKHSAFFEALQASHGRAELFVGWFLNGNTGDVLPHALMRAIAALGLDLALDLYPPDKPRPAS